MKGEKREEGGAEGEGGAGGGGGGGGGGAKDGGGGEKVRLTLQPDPHLHWVQPQALPTPQCHPAMQLLPFVELRHVLSCLDQVMSRGCQSVSTWIKLRYLC